MPRARACVLHTPFISPTGHPIAVRLTVPCELNAQVHSPAQAPKHACPTLTPYPKTPQVWSCTCAPTATNSGPTPWPAKPSQTMRRSACLCPTPEVVVGPGAWVWRARPHGVPWAVWGLTPAVCVGVGVACS
uniref:Uncharacterized protein n=1 Tax=Eutreptiella gymnastica TaxID=73025 RepID=A0A7S1HSU7_9EUGL